MSILAGILANALLFSSLLLVVGVPVFYMTQDSPGDNRNSNIRKIEILGGVWFVLVLVNGLVGGIAQGFSG
tara:strand:+ start:2052 stop:2264 length:213 start_codon:yes stop_codon:yes gene_type:complete